MDLKLRKFAKFADKTFIEGGKKKEWTIEYATNFLLKNGFEQLSVKSNNLYAKALFKNKNLTF